MRAWILAVLVALVSVARAEEAQILPPLTRAVVTPPAGLDVVQTAALLQKIEGVRALQTNDAGALIVVYDRGILAAMNLAIALTNGAAHGKVAPAHTPPDLLSKSPHSITVANLARLKASQMRRMAEDLVLRVDTDVSTYLDELGQNGWRATTNQFAALQSRSGQYERGVEAATIRTPLWQCVLEAGGGAEQIENWDPALRELLTTVIFEHMPSNSIYFGGTDSGRFIPSLFRELQSRPDLFVLTQNALADNTYLGYVRYWYGDRIWLPSPQDSAMAFQQYVQDVQAGRIPAGADVRMENGRVQVTGVGGVMAINGILAHAIFEANKASHGFYVEESYVIPWMYPYLEPDGAILRLNPQPLKELGAKIVDRDAAYWDKLEATLKANPAFATNSYASKAFSKMRSAIAGVYVARRMWPEAERAFRQASRICPGSPEAAFRMADAFAQQLRFDEAVKWIDQALPGMGLTFPDRTNQIAAYRGQLLDLQKKNERRKDLEKALAKGSDVISGLELLQIYVSMRLQPHASGLAETMLSATNLTPDIARSMAVLCQQGGLPDVRIKTLRRLIELSPGEWQASLELACMLAQAGKPDEAARVLAQGRKVGGAAAESAIGNDEVLRMLPAKKE